ncbi:sulfatase family protein [Arenibacter troitsensis]|uniref:Arylsulfatase A n=1 Tax=Arenibacter troitsensis TaxID=188872 RepID=A0A1X7J2Q0_9FLAO|nr:sulfatase [Arenibacter troitsensis]SMG21501.1 Arylsulfatase A [Arenibacter troitsensis]
MSNRKSPFALFHICLILIGLILIVGFSSCKEEKVAILNKKPNIIYIMTDDHGYQAMSAYNGGLNETPNIDRIAKNGVKFTRSFVTNSICSPSRAVMLTGKFSHLNGQQINSQKFDGSQMTFPKLLQKEGYQTAMIGKWHLGSDPTGFDYWNILPGQGDYYNPDFNEMGNKSRVEGYVTGLITKFSLDWLKNRDQEKPFAMLMHHKAPHRCWMPDTTYLEKYNDVKFPLPDNFYDDYENRTAAASQKMHIKDFCPVNDLKMYDKEGEIDGPLRKYFEVQINRMNPEQRAAWDKAYDKEIEYFKNANLSGKELMEWRYQRYLEDYLRCIASVDDSVGEILDYLEENGLAENTLVVYTSDQGFYLGEHGWFDKRFMYEESFRTPLLMQLPSRFKKGRVDQLVQNIDYAPTFLELAGVEVPEEMQGESLLPILEGKEIPKWREALYYHYYEYPGPHSVKRHYGVRTDRYKLIHFYNNIDQWELYDLKEDSTEMHNLYGKEGYAEITEDLHAKLEGLREQYKDTVALETN